MSEGRIPPEVPTLWSGFWEEGIPDLLLDMRVVQEWPIIPNPCPAMEVRLLGLRQMYALDYLKFLDRINKLESDFLVWKTAKLRSQTTVHSEWDGVGECPTCARMVGGKEEMVEKAQKWLKARGAC